ncbi:MAG: molybdopterin synthase sulfur carrier subunit [Micavibrio sp.]|nr:molybdopterin synthase sulfur carrier subunit [Micavibrio sp.]
MADKKPLQIRYFAILREQSGVSGEQIESTASTPSELYDELSNKYAFTLPPKMIGVAVNDKFADMSTPLNENDVIVFIPPVAGG